MKLEHTVALLGPCLTRWDGYGWTPSVTVTLIFIQGNQPQHSTPFLEMYCIKEDGYIIGSTFGYKIQLSVKLDSFFVLSAGFKNALAIFHSWDSWHVGFAGGQFFSKHDSFKTKSIREIRVLIIKEACVFVH